MDDLRSAPRPTADGSHTLYSARYAQTFHSHKGALTESKHVFLDTSGVTERLKEQKMGILEVGFGTGLNFFLTADVALGAGSSLVYTAVEQDLLPADLVTSLGYGTHLNHPKLLDAYLEFRTRLPEGIAGKQTFEFEGVRLELVLGEATEQSFSADSYDAVYQDAFSPDANPELWSPEFLSKLHAALKQSGVLTTYCVKGTVRRSLAALGFGVEKLPGPVGGKREMLRAVKGGPTKTAPVRADAPGNR